MKEEIDYKIKTAKVLNKLIKSRGLDKLFGELEENKVFLKLAFAFGIVIGMAAMVYAITKLIVFILAAPFLVYLVVTTVAFAFYLMIAIENQPGNKTEKSDEIGDMLEKDEEKEIPKKDIKKKD